MAFPYLLLAFITVPIIEIWLLLKVGSAIGVGSTILFVIFTAIIGAYLVRQQGFATLNAVQQQMNAGRLPAMEMAEGVALLIAGAVLLTPGFFTDALGFALLTPPIRRLLIKHAISRGYGSIYSNEASQPTPRSRSQNSVIEGEFSEGFSSQDKERK